MRLAVEETTYPRPPSDAHRRFRDLAGYYILGARRVPGRSAFAPQGNETSPVDLSGDQVPTPDSDRLLRESRFGVDRFNANPASWVAGGLRSRISLGPDGSAE